MDITVSGTSLFIGLAVLFAAIVAIIFFVRARYSSLSKGDLTERYKAKASRSPLEARTKYPEVDPFRLHNTVLYFGFAAALVITLLAFNWTTYEDVIDVSQYMIELDDEELEIEPPRTAEPPPPPPPPPPPVIEEVPEEEILEDEAPVFEDTDIEVEEEIAPPPEPVVEEAPPPPPPPPPPKEEPEEIFRRVEAMPTFPGCEDESDEDARKTCTQEKMLQFIYKNIKYPVIARENGIEGKAFVEFVVDKDGSIKNVKVLRDPGGGLGDEAKRVIEMMNEMGRKWQPGKQRGNPVKVAYTLPVNFKLQ
jgi:protein TonB